MCFRLLCSKHMHYLGVLHRGEELGPEATHRDLLAANHLYLQVYEAFSCTIKRTPFNSIPMQSARIRSVQRGGSQLKIDVSHSAG